MTKKVSRRKTVAVTARELAAYAPFYKEYTKTSLRLALARIKQRGYKLAAPTVDYYMMPRRFGGLGIGKLKK